MPRTRHRSIGRLFTFGLPKASSRRQFGALLHATGRLATMLSSRMVSGYHMKSAYCSCQESIGRTTNSAASIDQTPQLLLHWAISDPALNWSSEVSGEPQFPASSRPTDPVCWVLDIRRSETLRRPGSTSRRRADERGHHAYSSACIYSYKAFDPELSAAWVFAGTVRHGLWH